MKLAHEAVTCNQHAMSRATKWTEGQVQARRSGGEAGGRNGGGVGATRTDCTHLECPGANLA